MADDAQFDAFSGLMTPQSLAQARAAQLQGQLNQAGQLSGIDYAARSGGLMLGAGLAQASNGAPSLDDVAAQNQQMMMDPTGAPQTGDSYEDNAANYEALAKRFLSAGNASQASRFIQAAQIMRSEGANYKTNQLKQQLTQGQIADQRANDQYVVVDSSPDKNGIPQYKKASDEFSLFDDKGNPDPQAFKQSRQDAIQKARAAGIQNPTVMKVSDLESQKSQVAAIRANATLQAAQIRADAQAARDKAQGGDALDSDTLDLAVSDVLQDPSHMHAYAAWGKVGQPRRDQINAAIAQRLKDSGLTTSQLNAMRAQAKGDATTIAKIGPQLAQVTANEQLAHNNGDRLLELVDKVNPTQYKSINGLVQAVQKGTGGDDAAEFASVLTTFQSEAARIINGSPTGTGVLSDNARHELQQVVDGTLAPSSLKRVINRLYTEFSVRQGALGSAAKGAGLDMSSIGAKPRQPAAAPAGAPKVLNYNPTTGKFE